MKIIQKVLKVEGLEYYTKHLQIINQFLPVDLKPKEIIALSWFMSLEGPLSEDRFGTTARKFVMGKMGIKPGGLGNYLKSLLDKNYLYKDEIGRIQIKDFLLPEAVEQGYQFKIVKDGK